MKTENELIAEFMGVDFTAKDAYLTYPPPICKRFGQYDRSWDWLMPVVEKIEQLGFSTEICYAPNGAGKRRIKRWCEICHADSWATSTLDILRQADDYTISRGEAETSMQAIYKAVVEFIKWYNNQKK